MKTGRNDPCHCGSGKKFKKCCLKKEQEQLEQKFKDETEEKAAKKAAAPIVTDSKGKPQNNDPHGQQGKGKQSQVAKKPMGRVSRRDNKSS